MEQYSSPSTPLIQTAPNESHSSGVSWPAVFAGATVAAALGLVLLALGVGFGLSAVSPWSNQGVSGATLGTIAIAWLVAMQIISSAMGGYLAGRLRTRWTRIHGDEVHFRDTAHGFLAWALASIVTAAFLASAATSMLGHAARTGASEVSTNGSSNMDRGMTSEAYYVDALFRPSGFTSNADMVTDSTRAEANRILINALRRDDGQTADKTYLASLVASRTGLSGPAAARQVDDVLTQARMDLDTARRAGARTSLFIFLALFIGAFSASLAATYGGRQRDRVVTV